MAESASPAAPVAPTPPPVGQPDPLLACLLVVARAHGRTNSAEGVTAGLPMVDGRLTPYDPHLYFHGEESTLSARLYTHGWDVYAPNDVLLYHDYTHDRGRPKHWQDNRDWTRLNVLSFARVRHLLAGQAPTDPAALAQIDRYGLGTDRPLADFEVLAGVDFTSRTMRPRLCEA